MSRIRRNTHGTIRKIFHGSCVATVPLGTLAHRSDHSGEDMSTANKISFSASIAPNPFKTPDTSGVNFTASASPFSGTNSVKVSSRNILDQGRNTPTHVAQNAVGALRQQVALSARLHDTTHRTAPTLTSLEKQLAREMTHQLFTPAKNALTEWASGEVEGYKNILALPGKVAAAAKAITSGSVDVHKLVLELNTQWRNRKTELVNSVTPESLLAHVKGVNAETASGFALGAFSFFASTASTRAAGGLTEILSDVATTTVRNKKSGIRPDGSIPANKDLTIGQLQHEIQRANLVGNKQQVTKLDRELDSRNDPQVSFAKYKASQDTANRQVMENMQRRIIDLNGELAAATLRGDQTSIQTITADIQRIELAKGRLISQKKFEAVIAGEVARGIPFKGFRD